jgi:hypothetical protein
MTSAYRTFSYNGYSFEVPRAWSSRIQDGLAKEVIFAEGGKEVARLTCPPPTTGYELWDFTSTKRSVVRNNFMYDIKLDLGKPDAEAIHDRDSIAILQMTHRGYQSSGENVYWDAGYGCQLTSHAEDHAELSAIYRRIYRSVKVESWKLGLGAGLRFRYPAAWTVRSTDDADADWRREVFTDVNGVDVATIECPVYGRGAESFNLSIFERKLVKLNGKYGIKWMTGSRQDDAGKTDAYFESLYWAKPVPSSGYYDERAYSCLMVSDKDGQKGIFREIYKSLK